MNGGVPFQTPVLAESSLPSSVTPVIFDSAFLTGADGATTSVASETALELPAAFFDVTVTRMRLPTSACVRR